MTGLLSMRGASVTEAIGDSVAFGDIEEVDESGIVVATIVEVVSVATTGFKTGLDSVVATVETSVLLMAGSVTVVVV